MRYERAPRTRVDSCTRCLHTRAPIQVDHDQEEYDAEASKLAQSQQQLEESIEATTSAVSVMKAVVVAVEAHTSCTQLVQRCLSQEVERRRAAAERTAAAAGPLAALEESVAAASATVDEQRAKVALIESTINDLNGRCKEINTNVPTLLERKRQAVADRKFKDAKQFANQVKQLNDELSSANEKIKTEQSELEKASAGLRDATATLAAQQAKLAQHTAAIDR